MQFLITAYDGTDPDALARRLAARSAHLANVEPLAADGRMLMGGAILNAAGDMIGSATIVDFPGRAELDAWLTNDPYVTGQIWKKIDIVPFRVAVGLK